MDRLQQELKKLKPFACLEQEAFLNLLRTCEALSQQMAEVLKPAGVSATQYNVLRILRGAGEAGLPCGEVAERMVTHDPDVTRLMDRLEKRGLIARMRCAEDRRRVYASITAAGLELLKGLDEPVVEAHRKQLGHMGEGRLKELIGLLEVARANELRNER